MKIAFSTLGCPDFSWADIYSMAKDLGFDGIEIRGLGDDIFAVKAQPFTKRTGMQSCLLFISNTMSPSGCCLKCAISSMKMLLKSHNILSFKKLEHPSGSGRPNLHPGDVDDAVV